MAREKRKTRLDKSGSGPNEFIGFDAFGGSSTDTVREGTSTIHDSAVTSNTTTTTAATATTTWSPVYTGKDETLQALFPRISQKRDATTKVKALQELQSFFASNDANNTNNDRLLRRLQVEALHHWAWLYYHKLVYDPAAAVRAEALMVWKHAAAQRIPKAVTQTCCVVQPELLGMFWVAHADPATEVRAAARELKQVLHNLSVKQQRDEASSSSSSSSWPWQEGLIGRYASRILSYGRASVMQEALFSKKKSTNDAFTKSRSKSLSKPGHLSSATTTTTAAATEEQNDKAEERFERIVGTCLDALCLWLQQVQQRAEEANAELSVVDTAAWWKTLPSPKIALRQKTYHLLSAACSFSSPPPSSTGNDKPQLILPDNMLHSLVQALSTEKEATNLPTLLEATVAFCARWDETKDDDDDDNHKHDALQTLVKPLTRILKKACYGAQVRLWGPTLLPLTALLVVNSQEQNICLVQAAWEGRELTLGENDHFQLATAVAECTSFVLLRRGESSDDATKERKQPMVRDITSIWLQTLQFFLLDSNERRETSAAAKSQKVFAQQLAKNLAQFQEVSPDRAFHSQADWFWSNGISLSNAHPIAVCKLLQGFVWENGTQGSVVPRRLLPHLQTHFLSLLSTYQTNSGDVPSKETFEYFAIVLESCGPTSIFTKEGSLERFIMNELLRWIILHTSELSTSVQNEELVQQDFRLVHVCLQASKSKRASLWDSLLREVVLARVDLHWLVIGLKALEKKSENVASWISCNSLKAFAIDIAESKSAELALKPRQEEEEESSVHADTAGTMYERKLEFYRLCLGSLPDFPKALVDQDVLKKWVDIVYHAPNQNDPLLEALLELLISDRDGLATQEAELIILRSWANGGRLYLKYVPRLLKRKNVESFLRNASAQLQEQLDDLLTRPEKGTAKDWSGRASRFLEVCKEAPVSSKFSVASIRLVGLGDLSRWEKHPHTLYLCLLPLLESLHPNVSPLSIVPADGEGPQTLAAILSAIADGVSIASQGDSFVRRSNHCERLLAALGGRDIESDFAEATIQHIVSGFEKPDTEDRDSATALKRVGSKVAALVQLIETMFLPVVPIQSNDLKPEDVREGDKVWYISDPKEPNTRDPASVKKVHYDAQTGYYFTIVLEREDTGQERQTVLERLRQNDFTVSEVGIQEKMIGPDEQARRKRVRELLMDCVVRRFLHPLTPSEFATLLSEVISIVGGVVGLGVERGLGSASYELLQVIVGIQSTLTDAIEADEVSSIAYLLWSMALALGFGLNARNRSWSVRRMNLNVLKSNRMVLEMYNTEVKGMELDCATLAWITSTLEHLLVDAVDKEHDEHIEVGLKILGLLFRLANNVFRASCDNEARFAACVASRAVFKATSIMSKYSSELGSGKDRELEAETSNLHLDALVSLVARANDKISYGEAQEEPLFSALADIYDLTRRDASLKRRLALACRSGNSGAIASSLFDPKKRFLSLRLLELVAERSTPLQSSDGDVRISATTESNLPSWLEGLEEEEAVQIEEDVYIVAEWVPLSMMEEVERWAHADYEMLDETQTIGQLLTWLSFLHFVDAAAPSDFRNRPAFISYLGISYATNHILNLALLNEKTINDGKKTASPAALLMEDLVFMESSDFELSSIASVVLFRTIEVLPSLSRRWWEEECPKVYTSAVQSFVEKHVSPKILDRELERMLNASSSVFGDMNVSASSISREVTAQYVQDDFTLTVLISLPPAFPLRSAEVDCSKTLGVPQKRWTRWSLQIMLRLNNQGGTLKDALKLWKDNVDKEFEGVEPCPVCYSVLHVKTHKLPSLQCRTCNNRFHVECLNQWFRSSGKSQCVLCQQPWQGTRV